MRRLEVRLDRGDRHDPAAWGVGMPLLQGASRDRAQVFTRCIRATG